MALGAGCASGPHGHPSHDGTEGVSIGLSASRRRTRFQVHRTEDAWGLVSPEGRTFFSRGVCCVDQGIKREAWNPEKPGYAAWRFYGTPERWAADTAARLGAWGFTTVGAWSDHRALLSSSARTSEPSETDLYQMPILAAGMTAGAPWLDMWDPKIVGRMEEVARAVIEPLRGDPRVVGYYTDNEMGWWCATLFKMTLEHTPASGQRQRLIRLLRDTYGSWGRLTEDFDPEGVSSWEDLARGGGRLYLRPGGRGVRVARQFQGQLARRYYELTEGIVRRLDPGALVLGERYQSFYYPEVARAAGPHVDVVSTNLNASWNDGSFLRSYLDTLHALTGKPILASEIYLSAMENRSGNPNDSAVFPVVRTQTERADGVRTTLRILWKLPYVVGADWFQYYDEPTHGREDGENYNFGLVDIHNQPYAEVTDVFREITFERPEKRTLTPRADVSGGVPPAPPDPLFEFEPTRALKCWDRERGFVKPVSRFPLSDLYLCWTPRALYLGLYSIDIVEKDYYRGGDLPECDRALWTVRVNGRPPVHARLGAGREPQADDSAVRVWGLSGVRLNVRNIAVLEWPVARAGREVWQTGDAVEVECVLDTYARADRVEWKGRFRLAE